MINNENQAANSSSGRYQSYSSNYEQQTAFNSGGNEGGNTIGDGRQCMCGEPAHFGKKTSPGANQGKSFYACKKRR